MNQEIRKIYQDYLDVLSSYLSNEREILKDKLFLNHLKDQLTEIEKVQKIILDRGTILDFRGNKKFFISEELKEAHQSITDFWKQNGTRLLELIKTEYPYVKMALPNQTLHIMKKMAVYFDTLLIEDPFQISLANQEAEELLSNQSYEAKLNRWTLSLGDYLGSYLLVKDMLEDNLDIPIYLLCPRMSLAESWMEDSSFFIKKGMDLSINHINSQLDFDFEFSHIQELATIIQTLNNAQCIDLYNKFTSIDLLNKCLHMESYPGEFYSLQNPNEENVKQVLFHLLTLDANRFAKSVEVELFANSIHAIRGGTEQEWITLQDSTKVQQNELNTSVGVSKEYAIAKTLLRDKIPVFDKIDYHDLVNFRRLKQMEEIRSFFRVNSMDLSLASIDDFDDVCEKIETEFKQVLRDEFEKFERDKESFKRKKMLSTISFTTSLSFGLATAIFPALAALSIPVTVASALFGAASAKDVINHHLNGKKIQQEFANRPVNVFLAKSDEHN